MDSLIYMAIRYICFHWVKSAILMVCVTLSIFLPVVGTAVMDEIQTSLKSRAQSTPLIVGAKGSRLDLALHALYFDVNTPETIRYSVDKTLRDYKLGRAIPVYRKDHQGQDSVPIVGIKLSYVRFRNLEVAKGELFTKIGQCVIGSAVARRLAVEVGDVIFSQPKEIENMASPSGVKLQITGVLHPTGTPDDEVVFTDLKTMWILDGYGHGHQDLEHEKDGDVFLNRDQHSATVNMRITSFIEITDENVGSFHFHGSFENFPITAVIMYPDSEQAETFIQDRITADSRPLQTVRPSIEIEQLLNRILKVKTIFNIGTYALFIVTGLFLVLNTLLSVRLRQREMLTMFKMGCGRFTIVGLYVWEYLLILIASGLFALILSFASVQLLQDFVVQLIR